MTDDELDELISKSLAGEADEREKSLIKEFLRESDDNTLTYNKIREYWNAGVSLDQSFSEAVARKAFAEIGKEHRRIERRCIALNFWRAAAAVLLLITTGMALYFGTHPARTYTYYATQNNIANYTLDDGTHVKLNQHSAIAFADNYGKKKRIVELQGEAFFDVTRDRQKQFTVKTQDTETKVLGTRFNVRSDEDAKQVTVTLVKGSVRFEAANCQQTLKPNEELVYNATTGKYDKQKTDIQYNTAWTEGRYFYQDIPFGELLKKLEHIYSVKIELHDATLQGRSITTSLMTSSTVTETLEALQDKLRFRYKEENGTVTITKK